MTQSAELTRFYTEYYEWLQAGAPDLNPFRRDAGLCGSLRRWQIAIYGRSGSGTAEVYVVRREMEQQFAEHTGKIEELYPFNSDQYAYDDEVDLGITYLNPLRRQWVIDHADI